MPEEIEYIDPNCITCYECEYYCHRTGCCTITDKPVDLEDTCEDAHLPERHEYDRLDALWDLDDRLTHEILDARFEDGCN